MVSTYLLTSTSIVVQKGQGVERNKLNNTDEVFPINACDFLLRHETPRYAMIRYTTTRRQEGKSRNPPDTFFSIARQPAKVAMGGGRTKKQRRRG
jgi:hypothetical protein